MRLARPTFLALLAVCALLGAGSPAASAPNGPVPDTTGLLTPWRIEPRFPCVRDSVFMIVRGFVATPCDSFMGAEAIGPLHVRIRVQNYTDRRCFAAPFQFFPVPVPLGVFPAGTHTGLVDVETTYTPGDTGATVTTQQFRFEFMVAAECNTPPPPGPLPFVNTIVTVPEQPCTGQPTTLVVGGIFTDNCGQVIDSRVIDPGHVELTLKPYVLPDTACTLTTVPWRVAFDLGMLPHGLHTAEITLYLLVPDSTRTHFEQLVFHGGHQFWVWVDCDSVPPPPPGPLPYVTQILVGPAGPCDPGPICPEDSIRVGIGGFFPNPCFEVRGVEVIPSPLEIVPPPPPTVRVIVDDHGCELRLCPPQDTPWAAQAILPPWPAGNYSLTVELARVTCSDHYPPGDLFSTTVPLYVADSCPPPPLCLTAGFEGASGGVCAATVSKTRAAELTLAVAPTVALAGLQGDFRLQPTGLTIMKLEAIGAASGMLLSWTATNDGARFVLVAPSGAPIPPGRPGGALGSPVLRVTVASLTRGPIPERTLIVAENLLGSDIDGHGVGVCPPPPCADLRLGPPQAVICAELGCDFNADAMTDIRDLVLMVHCVNGEGPCPPDANTRFDCDNDSLLAIADVLCCAREILGQPQCPECTPDSIRPEPGVSMSFGDPETAEGMITVPLRFTGVDRVGAAKLTFDLPLDRYEVTGFDAGGSWLALHEERDGRLTLGMISIRSSRVLSQEVPPAFRLHLRLKPGATPGGAVTATAGEFSGPDGVALRVDLGRPTQALPGGGTAALSANQPNPFSRVTAFTLALPQAGDVTVTIYDLRGRAVTMLHEAPLSAGPHEFRWDGTQSDGTPAPNGVYFYRAVVSGQPLSRKLILMRGN